MELISAVQSQNARRLMGWAQEDLAHHAKIGVQTVRNFERGESTRPETAEKIRYTLEIFGVLFLEDDGVKWRNKWCEVYNGLDSCDKLFQRMTETVSLHGGEIGVFVSSPKILLEMSGIPRRNNLERLDVLHELTKIRCVLLASAAHPDFTPSFEYKVIPDMLVPFPKSIFTFGKQYADIQCTPDGRFLVVITDVVMTTQAYQKSLDNLWQQAVTLESLQGFQARLAVANNTPLKR